MESATQQLQRPDTELLAAAPLLAPAPGQLTFLSLV